MSGLSPRMLEALRLWGKAGGVRSAYPGVSLATVNALSARGMITGGYGRLGAMAFPANADWRLTDKGRDALARLDAEGKE